MLENASSLQNLQILLNATLPVQVVMALLLLASMVSWVLIVIKYTELRKIRHKVAQFEARFWKGRALNAIYADITQEGYTVSGLESIFEAGYSEFAKLRKQTGLPPLSLLEGVQRAMRVALNREVERIERWLAVLASIGSVSPYVGLFGTVWGIMNAFHALADVQQATLQMVAPGISEALIATAMGLFAAIPAVLAYNAYMAALDRLVVRYETFADEFTGILQRQLHMLQRHSDQ